MKKIRQLLTRYKKEILSVVVVLIGVAIIWGFYELFVIIDQAQAADSVGVLKGSSGFKAWRLK